MAVHRILVPQCFPRSSCAAPCPPPTVICTTSRMIATEQAVRIVPVLASAVRDASGVLDRAAGHPGAHPDVEQGSGHLGRIADRLDRLVTCVLGNSATRR